MSGRRALPVLLGILVGLTVLLQLGPVYWPGGGMLLAMAATLPAAVASALVPGHCTRVFLAVCILLGLLAPEEMFIYMCMTGALGLMLGLMVRRPVWQAVPASAAVLTGGMLMLPYLGGVWPMGGLERGWGPLAMLLVYGGVALGYAALWFYLLKRLLARLPFSRLYWRK